MQPLTGRSRAPSRRAGRRWLATSRSTGSASRCVSMRHLSRHETPVAYENSPPIAALQQRVVSEVRGRPDWIDVCTLAVFTSPCADTGRVGLCCSQGSATAGGPHDRENAHALSNALMVMTIIPWAFCCICYSGLHFTYPKVTFLHIYGCQARPSTNEC